MAASLYKPDGSKTEKKVAAHSPENQVKHILRLLIISLSAVIMKLVLVLLYLLFKELLFTYFNVSLVKWRNQSHFFEFHLKLKATVVKYVVKYMNE